MPGREVGTALAEDVQARCKTRRNIKEGAIAAPDVAGQL